MRQLSILQVVTTSHSTLHQLNSFGATQDNGHIFEGLGSIFGKAIYAITHGGSEFIKVARHGAKEGLVKLSMPLLTVAQNSLRWLDMVPKRVWKAWENLVRRWLVVWLKPQEH